MSTKTLAQPNQAIRDFSRLSAFIAEDKHMAALRDGDVDWDTGSTRGIAQSLWTLLDELRYTSPDVPDALAPPGIALIGRLAVDLQSAIRDASFAPDYRFESVVASGKNSITYKAEHVRLKRHFIVKSIRPGCAPGLADSLAALSRVPSVPALVRPVNSFVSLVPGLLRTAVAVDSLVFEFVEGRTLDQVLSDAPPQSPFFVPAYIRQVASGLAALQDAGLHHGDLHGGNIIVTEDALAGLNFRIIDISYGIGLPSRYEERVDDYDAFISHLRRILISVQRLHSNLSLKRHLRAQLFELAVDAIDRQQSFRSLVDKIRSNEVALAFKARSRLFVDAKFSVTDHFGTLRYEEIGDPNRADQLFEPFHPLYELVAKPQNTVLFGPRGSGKSTYLGSLAFFPEATKSLQDFHSLFGIFFSCRQGEFRQLSNTLVEYTPLNTQRVRHLLVLKMTRRLLYLLVRGVQKNRLAAPTDVTALSQLFEPTISRTSLGSFDSEIATPLENLHSLLLRAEAAFSEELFSSLSLTQHLHLDVSSLIAVCDTVRRLFPELEGTKFCFLFDDAGEPNVPREAQRILNDFVTASNNTFCVKISAERYSFETVNTDGADVADRDDTKTYDLARQFRLGSGLAPERTVLEQYFRAIVTRRLMQNGFRSKDITAYLGSHIIPQTEFLNLLRDGSKKAYYCGWDVVWELADRNPRQLLELVSHILAQAGVTKDSPQEVISPRIQDKAIRQLSERRVVAYSSMSGTISDGERTLARGRQMYNCASTFGKIARRYLRRSPLGRARSNRHWELLAIERDDSIQIDPLAERVLQQLVRAGIFDDSTIETARDDGLKKPIYVLNRVLCPHFAISFRRHVHLRLSHLMLERFLLEPERAFRRFNHKDATPSGQYSMEFNAQE